jgi:hypothetical protein
VAEVRVIPFLMNSFNRSVWQYKSFVLASIKYFPSMDDMIASDENIFDEWHYGDDTVRHLYAIT